jgi:hypothetical protein
MSAHTPIPWEYIAVQTSIGVCFKIGSREILAGDHGGACLYDDRTALNPHKAGEQEANAALIVEAVNNHEKLLARVQQLEAAATRALTTLTEWCDRITEGGTGWDDWDEYYKDANYERKGRPSVIDDLKAALKEQP